MLTFSIIVPVYNRPDEIDELLQSLERQTDKDFELIVVEDGSSVSCLDVCKKYDKTLKLKYFYKENSGPGQSRNYGAQQSSGNYLLILDSDVIVPDHYIATIRHELSRNYCDAFGGSDTADQSFSNIQKAVNYAMTSFITTGGIRGGKRQMEKFHPRTFNSGISKAAFLQTGGFSDMRYGEDIDLSIRIYKAGYSVRLLPDVFVYHKRRTDLKQFFNQVRHSGNARIALWRKHPDYKGSLKPVHLLPAAFTVGTAILIFAALISCKLIFLLPLLLLTGIVFIDSSCRNKSVKTGCLSVATSFVQLSGYGIGFLEALLKKKKAK